jgi:hypothetical protein
VSTVGWVIEVLIFTMSLIASASAYLLPTPWAKCSLKDNLWKWACDFNFHGCIMAVL